MTRIFLKTWLKTCLVVVIIALVLLVLFILPGWGINSLFEHRHNIAGAFVGFICVTFWIALLGIDVVMGTDTMRKPND